jgi:putative glutathione S-transferase
MASLKLLEWVPSQKLLVVGAKLFWNTLWRIMLGELAPQSADGAYVRPAPQSSSQPTWPSRLPMVRNRYHVYVGNPCPWCHRVAIVLALRGLSHRGGVTSTRLANDPVRASRGGWAFDESDPDPLVGASDLKAVYDACSGGSYSGRCTAPLLVDLEAGEIISNESSEICRMLNALEFGDEDTPQVDLYPPKLASRIDETNSWVYRMINNGVYRAGFATKQAAYEEAEGDVHLGMGRCDQILATSRFLCGPTVTESDVFLLPTAARFDAIYATLFRCGRRQIRSDYPNVRRWLREVLALSGPFDLKDAHAGYYRDLFPLNPGGIVPKPPQLECADGAEDRSPLDEVFTLR